MFSLSRFIKVILHSGVEDTGFTTQNLQYQRMLVEKYHIFKHGSSLDFHKFSPYISMLNIKPFKVSILQYVVLGSMSN